MQLVTGYWDYRYNASIMIATAVTGFVVINFSIVRVFLFDNRSRGGVRKRPGGG